MRRRCPSQFKEDGGCAPLVLSQLSQSVLEYFPDLSRAELLVGNPVGSVGRLSRDGGYTSRVPGNVGRMAPPLNQSLIPLRLLQHSGLTSDAASSARLRCRVGELYPSGWVNCLCPGCCCWEGLVYLRKNGCCVIGGVVRGDAECRYPAGSCFHTSLSIAFHPRLSLHHPPSAEARVSDYKCTSYAPCLKKNMALSPAVSISPWQIGALFLFTTRY